MLYGGYNVNDSKGANMLKVAKLVIKKLFRAFNLEIRRLGPADYNYAWLTSCGIRTVIDIGANIGQFALRIHNILPEAAIYSFEPLRDCYLKLVSNLEGVPRAKAFNYALGDIDGSIDMHRSRSSTSSSLLSMMDLHKQAFPHTKDETIEKVDVRCLDGIAADLHIEDNILVKIDVQGYENKVIAGGTQIISRAKVVVVETGVEELYEGQGFFHEIFSVMTEMGFAFKGFWDQLKSPIDGSVLSADAIFMRGTD